jgi:hypothetical protein
MSRINFFYIRKLHCAVKHKAGLSLKSSLRGLNLAKQNVIENDYYLNHLLSDFFKRLLRTVAT